MTGGNHRPDPAHEPALDDVSSDELDRTDTLLDQLAGGTIDLGAVQPEPGELAALTLLATATDPNDPSDSGAAATFVAAVRHRSPEHAGHTEPEPRRWRRFAGATFVAKLGIIAALSALGVAAAGATGGLVRQVLPDRDTAPTTSVATTPEAPSGAGGGDSSRIASGVPPQIRLLDEATLELLRSACAAPDRNGAVIVRELAERGERSTGATCAAVERESVRRGAADGDEQRAADETTTADITAADPGAAGTVPAAPNPGGGAGSDQRRPRDSGNGNGNGNGNGSPGGPNPGGSSNAGGNNPNANATPNPNAGANPSSGGSANQGNSPSSGGHPNPGGGNPNTGNPNTGNPNTGNPNTGNPNTGNPNTGNPNTGNPNTGNPNTGNPNTGNPNTGGGNPRVGGSASSDG